MSLPTKDVNTSDPKANAAGNADPGKIDPTKAAALDATTTENSDDPTNVDDKDSTVTRLLAESKKYKDRALKAEKEKNELIKKAQLEQGQYKELYEAAQKDKESLLKTVVTDKIKSAVKDVASKYGCLNPDAAMKLGNGALLQVEPDTLEVNGVDVFIENVKKEHPYLFQSAKPPAVNPAAPGGASEPRSIKANEFSKLPKDVQQKVWADAMEKLRK